jgi:hypothetical protein|tara:strand:- start:89 stop:346 length:258 start_codon:yes stop_codon:yes gene_type:complete
MVLKFSREEWFGNPKRNEKQRKKRQERAYLRKKNRLDSMKWELSDFYVDVLAGDRLSKTKRKKIINLKQNIDDVKEKILLFRGEN